MLITYICKDKNNNFYYIINITVVLTHVLAPPAPLGSRLRDIKTIPLHIHFPNEVFHLLRILPILYNAHCALDRNANLHVSTGKGQIHHSSCRLPMPVDNVVSMAQSQQPVGSSVITSTSLPGRHSWRIMSTETALQFGHLSI